MTMPTISSVFYYTRDLDRAVSLWCDSIGLRRVDDGSVPGWAELAGPPAIFIHSVEDLPAPESAIAVAVEDIDDVIDRCPGDVEIGDRFDVAPGQPAVNIHPPDGQSVLIHHKTHPAQPGGPH